MIYLRSLFFILLAFVLHFGCTALVHIGWPPQPLVILAVLAVWLDRTPSISRVILPAAFLVDLLQPTHMPVVTISVLVAWFVAGLVQRQWLTNHSLASLFGLAVLGVTIAATATGICLWLAASFGVSATPLSAAWSTRGLFTSVVIEVGLTLFIGVLLRGSLRFLRSRFLYAPH